MKNVSFSALVYREYLISKKSIRIYLISVIVFSLLPILIALSLRFGNLAMLPENIVTDIRGNNDLMLKLFAVITPCMLCISLSEVSVLDVMCKWDHFRRSTPVPPARMALAKYMYFAITLGVSFLLAITTLWLFTLAMNIPILKSDIAMILLFLTGICIMSVTSQIFIMLLRSVDKGMIAMLLTIAGTVVLLPKQSIQLTAEVILTFAEHYLFLFPILLIIISVIGFAVTTLVYKRREK